ncbi:MAG: rhamnulokinase, partial [Anaerohalosphaera sp.]|nr:rhamnulokinase [Anaerohalosphaera sp.]
MSDTSQYIAVDLGAESGRVMLGTIADGKLKLDEIHRFANAPVEQAGTLRWDFKSLFAEIKAGLTKAVKQADHKISGIAVDSWGVDFGLIDKDGKLIAKPYHYRDSHTDGMMEKAFQLIHKKAVYDNTGIQFLQFNTIYQLLAMRLANSQILQKANKLVFMADLVSYHLCSEVFGEYTLASTSQLMNMRTGRWAKEVFDKLSLPIDIMPDIVKPGTVAGRLTGGIANEIGCDRVPVIAVGSHDTASAVASVPAQDNNWAYLSSGTWSLIGVEVPAAIINDETYKCGFTNEGGVENTIRLLKNIMGLWLVQQCRRQWKREGVDLSYSELTAMAEKAEPFIAYLNPNHGDFFSPGDMPARINEYLSSTGQVEVSNKGQLIRVVLENLTFNYRWVLERIEEIIR